MQLLDYEMQHLQLLDTLISEANNFEDKIKIIEKKQSFISMLIELEKHRDNHRIQLRASIDKRDIEYQKESNHYWLASQKESNNYSLSFFKK